MDHQAAAAFVGDSPTLLIAGASGRALASSAAAIGWRVDVADLFGDLDLREAARHVRCVANAAESYPASLVAAMASLPAGPWCYVGALENHPTLIDAVSTARPLVGNDGRRVRAVRDHRRLAEAVQTSGLCFPHTCDDPCGLPTDGSFVIKPRASAGGRGIGLWQGGPSPGVDHVWQRRIDGIGIGASFACGPRGARLMGIAHQHTGLPWCHAGRFAFCAAVRGTAQAALAGVTSSVADQVTALGELLVERFHLTGAVGVDAVIDDAGCVWVIEVNPRPTASMELHERASGESVAAAHLQGCGFPAATAGRAGPVPRDCAWAKAVVHAPYESVVSTALITRWRSMAAAWTETDGGWPALADIPCPPQTIRRGGPLVTVFAMAADPPAALAAVERRAAALVAMLPAVSRPSAAAVPLPAVPGSA